MSEPSIILVTGIAASALTSVSMLPQLIKMIKEESADDISIPMLLILITGLSLWIAYGIQKKDYVVLVANALAVAINMLVLGFALKYKCRG